MLKFVIVGLVLGGIYALSATGLVITYQASGVFNFAFSAIACTVARFDYYLNSQEHWSVPTAAILAVFGLGPVLALVLYGAVFRFLRLSSALVKVMATIGIAVALPAIDTIIFGTATILSAPGLAPQPVRVFLFLGVPVTLDQIIVYGCAGVFLVGGFFVLRYTDIGLQVRALVDSPALTDLSGVSPSRLSAGIWLVSITMAGVIGILVAPISGLDPTDMTLLMVTAFAAAIAGRLRNLPIAVAVAFGIGIAGALIQYWVPPAEATSGYLIEALPFIVTAVSLVLYAMRAGVLDESKAVGTPLDHAIHPRGTQALQGAASKVASNTLGWRPSAFAFGCVLVMPLLLHGFWPAIFAQGLAYATIFLSFSLVTGDGGMIWLCQATFAGVGWIVASRLAGEHHLPVLLALLFGGLVVAPVGVVIGYLTVRMGNIYVTLSTLTFGLLADEVLFPQPILHPSVIAAPRLAAGDHALIYFCLGVFAVLALVIVNVRRSTIGLGFAAVRTSPAAARTIGMSAVQMKLLLAGLAAFVAGIGGAMLAITLTPVGVSSSSFATLGGEIWLAALVTQGIRSNMAALFAGLTLTVLPGICIVYLPLGSANFPLRFFRARRDRYGQVLRRGAYRARACDGRLAGHNENRGARVLSPRQSDRGWGVRSAGRPGVRRTPALVVVDSSLQRSCAAPHRLPEREIPTALTHYAASSGHQIRANRPNHWRLETWRIPGHPAGPRPHGAWGFRLP